MRKKVRKSLAFLLALALVVSVMSGLGLSVSADDAQNEPVVTETEGEPAEEKPKAEENTSAEGGKEETADPDAETVPEEKKDEQKAEGEGSSEKAAENKDAATPKAGENVQTATIGTGDKTVTVKTTAAAGVLPEGAKLVVKKLANQDQAYQDAESTLKDSQVTYDDFLALDVGFEVNGKEVEPEAGSVQVQFELGAGLLPETADTSTLAVQHLTDGKAETVADAGAVTAGDVTVKNEVVKADFEVKSFSTFTITWGSTSGYGGQIKLTVHYVNEAGFELDVATDNVTISNGTTVNLENSYKKDIADYNYFEARYGSYGGQPITDIQFTSSGKRQQTFYATFLNNTTEVYELATRNDSGQSQNQTQNIYLVYQAKGSSAGSGTAPVITQELNHEKYVTKNNDDDKTYNVNLTVSGKIGNETNKAKVDVVFVMDVSNSMNRNMADETEDTNERIKAARTAINQLTSNLSNSDNLIDARYSLVAFSSRTQKYNILGYPSGPADKAYNDADLKQDWTSDWTTFANNVNRTSFFDDNSYTTGGTNYEAGLMEANKLLGSARSDATRVVIFLSDGNPGYYYDAKGITDGTPNPGTTYDTTAMQNAKNVISGMSTNYFYTVGVGPTDNYKYLDMLTAAVPTGTKTHATYEGTSDKELENAFKDIKGNITDLACNNVLITDYLSENVDMVMNGENPADLRVIVKDKNGQVIGTPEGIYPEYDAATKRIRLVFPAEYKLEPDLTYIITAKVKANEKAYERVRANGNKYPEIGDEGTGKTSEKQGGVYTNVENDRDKKAKVTYMFDGKPEEAPYDKPVIQLEPAHLTINKTITGLTEEQIDAALKSKLTFNITYTYPDKTTGNAQVKLDKVTAGENGEYTFTYTSGDIWSMGATYKVTETGYDAVTDYVCNPTATDASGEIPKYSTATASFTNTYTKATQDLTITKEIWVDGEPYTGDEFKDAEYTFTVNGGKLTEAKTVTVKGAGSAPIEGLPVGSYKITETSHTNEPAKYEFKEKDSSQTIVLSKENHAVTITNKYETKKCKVYVRKELDGNMYDSSDRFDFTVDGEPLTLGKDQTSGAYEVTYGDSFTVKETDDKGYTSTTAKAYKATVNNDGTVSKGAEVNGTYTDGAKSYTLSNITEDIIIVYTNTKTINPPNGIITTIAPYAIMVVLAAGAGVYFVYSRRRRNG